MRVLPLYATLSTYFACCGKTICGGCNLQHQIKNSNLQHQINNEEQRTNATCAFCRTKPQESDEELLAWFRKRVELKDPQALCDMALYYGDGGLGLPVDHAKCIELFREAADLGFPSALHHFGNFHRNGDKGLEQNEEKALQYFEEAAEGGHLISRHNLGILENRNGDHVAAMRHFRLSASGGSRSSMTFLIRYFEYGWLHHGDLAMTMLPFYCSRAEMKSKGRDFYIKFLKRTGEYEARFDV